MTEAVEAVKCALRQSDKGMVVSFVVHPNDDASHLITMPIGQRVMLAVAPFIESGADTAVPRQPAATAPRRAAKSAGPTSPTPSGLPPPLPPAAPEGRQQSPGSGDAREAPPTRKSKGPILDWPLSQQAGFLCGHVGFQLWASREFAEAADTVDTCATWMRKRLGIRSRAQLDDENEVAARFNFCVLRNAFLEHNGGRL